jgi:hypothetical protein
VSAENDLRKDFTPSERVEIGMVLEGEIRSQAEKRMKSGVRNPVENFPQSEAGAKTRDLAAKAAGFGNGKKDYFRHSRAVIRDPRWPALRLAAKRRDGFRCVQCGTRGRLEVDHIQPVRDAPELAFVLDNLQSLCGVCHGKKTIRETGLQNDFPHREKWLESVQTLLKGSRHVAIAENRTPPVRDSGEAGGPCWN